MALIIRPLIPMLISSSHADLKSCTPILSMTPPKQKSWKIYCLYSRVKTNWLIFTDDSTLRNSCHCQNY